MLTNEEFFRVLKAVKDKELGKQKLSTGEIKSLYKPWLRQAILLSLFTGRRTAEIFQLRFSDVLLDKNKPRYIRTEDIKINRSHYKEGKEKKYIILAVTKELKNLLNDELDYETNKGNSKYLIANDERMKRSSMERHLWRAFAHYSKKVNDNPKLTFKVLRKTNLSRLAKEYGRENTRILSGHNKTSGLKVLDDSYFDKKLLSQVAEGFSMLGSSFPKKERTK